MVGKHIYRLFQIVALMNLLVTVAWASCIVETSEVRATLLHSWLALATLPWMTAEVTWMDLKPVNARNLAQCAARLQWTSGMTALFFILFDLHCCVVCLRLVWKGKLESWV